MAKVERNHRFPMRDSVVLFVLSALDHFQIF